MAGEGKSKSTELPRPAAEEDDDEEGDEDDEKEAYVASDGTSRKAKSSRKWTKSNSKPNSKSKPKPKSSKTLTAKQDGGKDRASTRATVRTTPTPPVEEEDEEDEGDEEDEEEEEEEEEDVEPPGGEEGLESDRESIGQDVEGDDGVVEKSGAGLFQDEEDDTPSVGNEEDDDDGKSMGAAKLDDEEGDDDDSGELEVRLIACSSSSLPCVCLLACGTCSFLLMNLSHRQCHAALWYVFLHLREQDNLSTVL